MANTADSQNKIAQSLIRHGLPRNMKVAEGGIGVLIGDVHNYNNKLFIQVGSEKSDLEELSEIPFKQMTKAMAIKRNSGSWTSKWWGLVSIAVVFVITQVVLLYAFKTFYLPTANTQFSLSESGVVEGANMPNGPRMLERAVWLAQPPVCPPDPHPLPTKKVIILHSETEECATIPDCVKIINYIQHYHIYSKKWCDIGFNFIIGGDGNVYEGRGWDVMGANSKGHNNGTIGVAFVGTFIDKLPNAGQLEAYQRLVNVGISLGKLDRNYTLVANCQLTVSSDPGWTLAHNMTSWHNFDSRLPLQCTRPAPSPHTREEL